MSEVLKIIDSKTDELDPIFREFNVLHTEGARRRSARLVSITGFQSSESVVVLWLAGLCAFLVALLVLVVCLCLHQRSKYLRKLRAASCQPSSSTPYDAVLPPSAATPGGIRPVKLAKLLAYLKDCKNEFYQDEFKVSVSISDGKQHWVALMSQPY